MRTWPKDFIEFGNTLADHIHQDWAQSDDMLAQIYGVLCVKCGFEVCVSNRTVVNDERHEMFKVMLSDRPRLHRGVRLLKEVRDARLAQTPRDAYQRLLEDEPF